MESNLEKVIRLMVASGESACFIGQVIKLHFLGIHPTRLHFTEGGATVSQTDYRHEKAVKYYEML